MKKLLIILNVLTFPVFGSLVDIQDTMQFESKPCSTIDECNMMLNKSENQVKTKLLLDKNNHIKTTLGLMYLEANDNNKDINKGLELITQAANKDFALAEGLLGLIYYSGINPDIKKDLKTSSRWFLKSATHGFALSQYHVAIMYMYGTEFRKNLKMAVYWLKQAASRDQIDAMDTLGDLYIQGKGVEKNIKRGQAWKQRAVNKKRQMEK